MESCKKALTSRQYISMYAKKKKKKKKKTQQQQQQQQQQTFFSRFLHISYII